MNTKHKFDTFNKIIIRKPIYSLNDFTKIPLETEKIDDFIFNLFKDEVFKEGIYIATPELYYEWQKSCIDIKYPTDKRKRINNSILKYYIRATTNPVPFGLFSSYSIIDKNGEVVKTFKMTEETLERVIEKIDDLESYYEEQIEDEDYTESEDYMRLMRGKG